MGIVNDFSKKQAFNFNFHLKQNEFSFPEVGDYIRRYSDGKWFDVEEIKEVDGDLLWCLESADGEYGEYLDGQLEAGFEWE